MALIDLQSIYKKDANYNVLIFFLSKSYVLLQ